ncbi:MAG TPA: Rieske 2Fe-2S domain-containing protein [Acidimicrobiales bacterium]|nr:Rieske 2Fe-2S domain-containing protein [Acidimicrobiales bacterium]
MGLYELVERLGRVERLDAAAKPTSKAVGSAVAPRPVKDTLSGSWLGHPLHPLLTDIPIGAWVGSLVLDLVGGRRSQDAADQLIGLGVVAALPTAATGLSDWSDTLGAERRIGFVHAVANVSAVACYSAAYVVRRRGSRATGMALSLAGAALVTVGGYLGGHLSYSRGVNVNRNAWEHGVDEWAPVVAETELRDGEPVVVQAGDMPVLVVRQNGSIHAIADRCGHAGGPLHEGTFEDGCVVCPWHQSTFRLADGGVVHGPATMAQPAYDVRVEDGTVMVRSAPPA